MHAALLDNGLRATHRPREGANEVEGTLVDHLLSALLEDSVSELR